MASGKTPAICLLHIIGKADAIAAHIAAGGLTFESFRNSGRQRQAVEEALRIMAEAAGFLPTDLKENAPSGAWEKLKAIDSYLREEDRDFDAVVWQFTQESLPQLVDASRQLLARLATNTPERFRA